MSAYIKQVIENHEALTHGHVLCRCRLDFSTDELHRAHVANVLETGMSNRIKYLEAVMEKLMALGNREIDGGNLVTGKILVATMHRIMADEYETIYRGKK